LSMTIKDIRPAEDLPILMDAIEKSRQGIYRMSEWRHRKKDGTLIDVEITSDTIPFAGRKARLTHIRDITEGEASAAALRQSEEQLRQSQKLEAIGQLAGGIAHDFNNLLTVIAGYSDLSLIRLQPEDPMRYFLQEIKNAGDRAASLTRQLLAF